MCCSVLPAIIREGEMPVQTVNVNPTIEWDDGLDFIFSFNDASNHKRCCGIIHRVLVVQLTTQQVNLIPAQLSGAISAGVFQGSSDPQTWIESVKTAARDPSKKVTVVYDEGP